MATGVIDIEIMSAGFYQVCWQATSSTSCYYVWINCSSSCFVIMVPTAYFCSLLYTLNLVSFQSSFVIMVHKTEGLCTIDAFGGLGCLKYGTRNICASSLNIKQLTNSGIWRLSVWLRLHWWSHPLVPWPMASALRQPWPRSPLHHVLAFFAVWINGSIARSSWGDKPSYNVCDRHAKKTFGPHVLKPICQPPHVM